jgi:serine/threonine protein kinase
VAYLAFEFCPGEDLFDYVRSGRTRYNIRLCRALFAQVLAGLDYMHRGHGIAHMDLKLENVVVDQNLSLKIIDFAFCEKVESENTKFKGTENYVAPEVVAVDNKLLPFYKADKADLYSLGVLLFILYFGNVPGKPNVT